MTPTREDIAAADGGDRARSANPAAGDGRFETPRVVARDATMKRTRLSQPQVGSNRRSTVCVAPSAALKVVRARTTLPAQFRVGVVVATSSRGSSPCRPRAFGARRALDASRATARKVAPLPTPSRCSPSPRASPVASPRPGAPVRAPPLAPVASSASGSSPGSPPGTRSPRARSPRSAPSPRLAATRSSPWTAWAAPLTLAAGLRESLFPMDDLAVMGFAELIRASPRSPRASAKPPPRSARRDPTSSSPSTPRPSRTASSDASSRRANATKPPEEAEPRPSPSRKNRRSSRSTSRPVSGRGAGRGRLARLERAGVDLVLCLLPNEPEAIRRAGVDAAFVGHPAAEDAAMYAPRASPRAPTTRARRAFVFARGVRKATRRTPTVRKRSRSFRARARTKSSATSPSSAPRANGWWRSASASASVNMRVRFRFRLRLRVRFRLRVRLRRRFWSRS